MRAGILTFHRGPNYGGFLQAWWLRRSIEALGCEVEVINYKNEAHYRLERRARIHAKRVRGMFREFLGLPLERKRRRVFEECYPQLAQGDVLHDSGSIDWARYDVVVVGSDVVWDYTSPQFGSDPIYFGLAPSAEKSRWISYAASAGKAADDPPLRPELAQSLSRFTHVSVRDRATSDLVMGATRREPTLVTDPTWLPLNDPAGDFNGADRVLAVYGYVSFPKHVVRQIQEYARRHSLRIASYGYYHPWADKSYGGLTPFEWVDAIGAAHSLATGTFHGALYGILLRKRFVVIGNAWIRSKIAAPLKDAKAENLLISEATQVLPRFESQSSEQAADRLSAIYGARVHSEQFLSHALNANESPTTSCSRRE